MAILYPLFVLALVTATGFHVAVGRRRGFYMLGGIGAFGSTVGYGLSLLLLNSVEELRPAMALISPGFGWAVLLVGAFLLVLAGLVRPPVSAPRF